MKRKICFILLILVIFTIGFFHKEQSEKEASARFLDELEYKVRNDDNKEIVFHLSNIIVIVIRDIPPNEEILNYAILHYLEMGLKIIEIRGNIHFQYVELINFHVENCSLKINNISLEPEYWGLSHWNKASDITFQLGFNTSIVTNCYNISKTT